MLVRSRGALDPGHVPQVLAQRVFFEVLEGNAAGGGTQVAFPHDRDPLDSLDGCTAVGADHPVHI